MKISKLVSAIILISVAAASAAGWFWLTVQSPQARAKDAVRHKLVDPDSAVFSDVSQGDTNLFWCGTVNSRNGFGGMSGPKHFMVELLPTSEFKNGIVNQEFSRITATVDILIDATSAERFLKNKDRCFQKN